MSDTPVDRTSMEPVGGVARAGPSAWALMLDLARQGATGRLDLTLETGVAVWVWLRDGQVCSVSGPHERPLLGATLLAGGVVTSEQLATALAVAREDASRPDLALVLIESGVPAHRVRAARAAELRAALQPAILGHIVATSFGNGLILPGAQLTVGVDDLLGGHVPGAGQFPATTPADISAGTAVPTARDPHSVERSSGTQGQRPEQAPPQPAGGRQTPGPRSPSERPMTRHDAAETASAAAGNSSRPIWPTASTSDPMSPAQDPARHDNEATAPSTAEPGEPAATGVRVQSQDQRNADSRPGAEDAGSAGPAHSEPPAPPGQAPGSPTPPDTATESMSQREVIDEFRGVYD